MTDKLKEHTPQEILMYLRQCLLPGSAQNGIDLEVPSWLVGEAIEALATFEQRLEELEDYKKEVEEIVEVTFQFAMRRINTKEQE